MQGYVARKGDRYYAVIYEGIDPLTGGSAGGGIPPAPTKQRPRALASDLADRHRREAAMSAAASQLPCT